MILILWNRKTNIPMTTQIIQAINIIKKCLALISLILFRGTSLIFLQLQVLNKCHQVNCSRNTRGSLENETFLWNILSAGTHRIYCTIWKTYNFHSDIHLVSGTPGHFVTSTPFVSATNVDFNGKGLPTGLQDNGQNSLHFSIQSSQERKFLHSDDGKSVFDVY